MKQTNEIVGIINPKEILNIKDLKNHLDNLYLNQTSENLNILTDYIIETTYNYLNAVYYNDQDLFKLNKFQKLFKEKHSIIFHATTIPKFIDCEKNLAEYFTVLKENEKYKNSFFNNKDNDYFYVDNNYLINVLKDKLKKYPQELYANENKLNWFIKHNLFSILILKTFLFNGNMPYKIDDNTLTNLYTYRPQINYITNIIKDILDCPKLFRYFRGNFREWCMYFMCNIIQA